MPSAQSPVPSFSPAQTAAIIDATTDPDLSFRAIAEMHNISVETLALFLDRPDIKERLAKIDSSISSRTQSLANASLPSVVKALTRAVEVYLWEENRIVVRPTDFAQLEQRRRATETMRRAGWLLSRLTRPPTPPRPPRDPDGPSRAPRAPEPPSAPKKTQGFPSLGPAPDATRAPTPTPDHIDETSAPLAPQSPSRKPSLADDAAILRQLAAGRQAAGRVLHAITGIAPPPEDPDDLDEELDEDEINDPNEVGCPEPEPSSSLPAEPPDAHATTALDLVDLCAPIVFLPITPDTPPLFPLTPNSRASRLIAAAGTTTPGPAP
jgi:hypothetical protein